MARELPRFSLVYVTALVANLASLPIALRLLPFSIYLDQAIFFSAIVVCSYPSHKYVGAIHTQVHKRPFV